MKDFSPAAPCGPVDVVVLFSGGLDSILAARILMEQGLKVRCLHFVSPFFGDADAAPRRRELYGLDILVRDAGEEFCAILRDRPRHLFGKTLNPCVDCKILLLRLALDHMRESGARLLATGEVLGQRPMSQRRDALQVIRRDAGVEDVLLRPLCGRLLPIPPAAEGLVDVDALPALSGRGRGGQLALAERLGITDIPTPGGGCRLTERENARRYWPVLRHWPHPGPADFHLANLGRQFWRECGGRRFWLAVGRNERDNEALRAAMREGDLRLELRGIPGPAAVARGGEDWPEDVLREAAALSASYSGRARAIADRGGSVRAEAHAASGAVRPLEGVIPGRESPWREPPWDEAHEEIRAEQRERIREAERARKAGGRRREPEGL